ncbi:MAG: glycosyltransferase, partial [Planctomycetota bacterium]
MSQTPEISVLMPVFNADRYVMYAVQSVLHQSFRSFEFIIIDDGSKDASLAILRHFEASDERIRLVSRPNTGYVTALNEMLEMARGRFLARMDAD